MNDIHLRDATTNDKLLIFKWRNIDTLVALSYQQKKVTLQEHQQWFKRKIINLNCKLLIIQLKNESIGLIRIELERGECEITIYLIPGYEGQGFGHTALSQAIDNCTLNCKSYLAKVQSKNIPSQKLFQKLGFSEVSENDAFILYNKIHI
jgi:UDP-2,4-diacetamido-2,4,6-trideoxy-beta-L-altropyranose hydrolase